MLAAPGHCQRFARALTRSWRTALTVRHVAAIVSALVFGSAGRSSAARDPPGKATRDSQGGPHGSCRRAGNRCSCWPFTLGHARGRPRPDQGRHPRLRAAERRRRTGIPPTRCSARASSSATTSSTTWPRAISRPARSGPSLAVSWKNLDDTTWEVKLRQGVKFHDGTPFTAKDVKATFDRVLNPENKLTARGNHAKIKSVEVVDDLHRALQDRRPLPALRRAAHRPGDAVREGRSRRRATSGCRRTRSAPGPTSS